ncbi:MAG: hypothetical protein AAFO07_04260 [Bacteroidota bacterium]
MATAAELKKENEQLRQENEKIQTYLDQIEALKAQTGELQKVNEDLKLAMDKEKGGIVAIPGSIAVNLEDTESGEEKKVTLGIADNHPMIAISEGIHETVSSTAFMRLATDQMTEVDYNAFPVLKKWKKQQAIDWLVKLHLKGSGFIKVL